MTVATLADYSARIRALEEAQRTVADELRALKNWIMAVLAAGLMSLLFQILKH